MPFAEVQVREAGIPRNRHLILTLTVILAQIYELCFFEYIYFFDSHVIYKLL